MEWLEGEPPSPELRRRQRLVVGGIAVGSAVIALVAFAIYQTRPDPAQQPAANSPSHSVGRQTPAASTSSGPEPKATESSDQPQVRRITSFLTELDVDIFARSSNAIYRIQTRRQTITATPTDRMDIDGPVPFITGPTQVVLRGYDTGASSRSGSLVPDGRPAQAVQGLLATADDLLPGPPGRVWVASYEETPTLRLSDFSGRPARDGSVASVVRGYQSVIADGSGGLLLQGVGGSYQLTREGPRRITRGAVIATGRGHILTSDCSDRYRCSYYLYDRATHQQRRVGPDRVGEGALGTVSRDGRYAAIVSWQDTDQPLVRVLDLRTGTISARLDQGTDAQVDPNSLIWLPGDRLLRITDGALVLYNAATRTSTTPDLGLPNLLQLTIRS